MSLKTIQEVQVAIVNTASAMITLTVSSDFSLALSMWTSVRVLPSGLDLEDQDGGKTGCCESLLYL